MEKIYIELVARLGIDLALVVLRNLAKATTTEDAIKALETTKTAQEYVDVDALERGITPVPLPPPAQ